MNWRATRDFVCCNARLGDAVDELEKAMIVHRLDLPITCPNNPFDHRRRQVSDHEPKVAQCPSEPFIARSFPLDSAYEVCSPASY